MKVNKAPSFIPFVLAIALTPLFIRDIPTAIFAILMIAILGSITYFRTVTFERCQDRKRELIREKRLKEFFGKIRG